MGKLTLFLAIAAIVSYCLGGINGAIITSVNYFKKDIRNYGSGNAGLTNYSRTFGEEHVFFVLCVDILKSVIAVMFGGWLLGHLGLESIGRLLAGFCAILGHIYPPYYELRGGKGVLCAAVIALMVDWRVGLLCLIVFGVIVIFTKYVSLGSMIGTLCFPILMWCFGYTGLEGVLGLLSSIVIVFAHRDNIKRLINGTESKLAIGSKGRDG